MCQSQYMINKMLLTEDPLNLLHGHARSSYVVIIGITSFFGRNVHWVFHNNSQYVRKHPNSNVDKRHCVERCPFPRKYFSHRGCISPSGPATIKIIRGTMDSSRYIETLRDYVLPFSDFFTQFQQHNAPCHNSVAVKSFMVENNLNVMPRPSCSPDLNIIENAWYFLKQKVGQKIHLLWQN